MKPIQLTDEQRQALWQLKRDGRNHEERWRARVILDCSKGLSQAAVAERNDCSVPGVDKVLMRLRAGGVQALPSVRFGPCQARRKLSESDVALLDQAMQQTPRAVCPGQPEFDRSVWTLDLLVRYLRHAVGVEVSDDTVRRYLLQLGWTTRAPKLTCHSPDPQYSEKRVAIGKLREAAPKKGPCAPVVVYCDEAQRSTQPTLRRCQRPRGPHQPLPHNALPKPVRHLHGAVSYPDGQCYFRVLPGMAARDCISFLEGLLEQFAGREVHVICDSAPGHRAKAMTKFLQMQPRLHLQYQPTYAPWTNPVERVWQEMRRSVTHCHDLADLATLLDTALAWCQRFGSAADSVCRLVSSQSAVPA